MTTGNAATERTAINTMCALAIDMMEQANSGHPGLPMRAALQVRIYSEGEDQV